MISASGMTKIGVHQIYQSVLMSLLWNLSMCFLSVIRKPTNNYTAKYDHTLPFSCATANCFFLLLGVAIMHMAL